MNPLSHLFGRPSRQLQTYAPVQILDEGPLYAVGDIHGHLAHYDRLEAAILADAHARGEDRVRIVTLGDYVDRGPDSAGVLDRLSAPPPPGVERHSLKGNHEVMFEQFLQAPDLNAPWLDMGGRETLASYGLYTDQMQTVPRHAAQMVQSVVPQEHMDFMAGLPLAFSTRTHFLCHAGVDPMRPLDEQDEHTLLWIRNSFLNHEVPPDCVLDRVIVHGHTPCKQPELLEWRINVDTGVYSGGPLTAVRLDGIDLPCVIQTD
ncbi:metallophosphoesterase [Pontivivens nitratireducens]|uniref:Serine/threonine protein phosphatase n=1 Tax=Pontivivens nitratireducens TaxID=2758038 RepID=A0A6G7VR65_9RHOB|nr:metallophosphoesterase [Pontibrevibacter nitratireducens]QIK42348.1 serine/threonine protein phosphatase [Pontibrevibacter nitratireducens]